MRHSCPLSTTRSSWQRLPMDGIGRECGRPSDPPFWSRLIAKVLDGVGTMTLAEQLEFMFTTLHGGAVNLTLHVARVPVIMTGVVQGRASLIASGAMLEVAGHAYNSCDLMMNSGALGMCSRFRRAYRSSSSDRY